MYFLIKVIFVILVIILACVLINYFKKLIIRGSWEVDYDYIKKHIPYIQEKMGVIKEAIDNWDIFSDDNKLNNEIFVNLSKGKINVDPINNNKAKENLNKINGKKILFMDPVVIFFTAFQHQNNLISNILLAYPVWKYYFERIEQYLSDAVKNSSPEGYFNIYRNIYDILSSSISTGESKESKLFILDILMILNVLINLNILNLYMNLLNPEISIKSKEIQIIGVNIGILYVCFMYFLDLRRKISNKLEETEIGNISLLDILLDKGWSGISFFFRKYSVCLYDLIRTSRYIKSVIDQIYESSKKRNTRDIEIGNLILPNLSEHKLQNKSQNELQNKSQNELQNELPPEKRVRLGLESMQLN